MSRTGDFDANGKAFIHGKLGILEPAVHESGFVKMDIVLIPGIAFSVNGDRIGFGKGYYDKYLTKYLPGKLPLLIAPVFDFQITDGFISEPHDIPVDVIVSELRVIHTNSGRGIL
mgnify:FL=1